MHWIDVLEDYLLRGDHLYELLGVGVRAAVGAMRKTFAQIRKDGGIAGVESQIATVEDIFDLQGMAKVKDDEKRFLR